LNLGFGFPFHRSGSVPAAKLWNLGCIRRFDRRGFVVFVVVVCLLRRGARFWRATVMILLSLYIYARKGTTTTTTTLLLLLLYVFVFVVRFCCRRRCADFVVEIRAIFEFLHKRREKRLDSGYRME
jgi:hypothetical protein